MFQLNSGEGAEIHSIDSNGGSARKLINGQGPGLSRDGRWIYLMRLGNDGVPQIWKSLVDSKADQNSWIQVTRAGGEWPIESSDGRFLYFAKNNGLSRMRLPDGPEQQVLPSLIYPANYALVEDGVFFIPEPARGEKESLQFLDFRAKTIRVIRSLDGPVMWGLTAPPHGRSVLYSRMDHWRTDLMMLDGFR